MRQPGGRSFAFISGFMIGILSALGVVFLLMNDLNPVAFNYKNPFAGEVDTLVDRTVKTKILKEPKKQSPSSVEVVHAVDSTRNLATDTSYTQVNDGNGLETEPVIRRDELLLSKTIEATRSPQRENPKTKTDSLIRQFSEAAASDPAKYKVEFWKSPVNYKGYRLIRNSLVLFGLSPDVPISLQQESELLILKYGNQTFRLSQSESFEPLPKPLVE